MGEDIDPDEFAREVYEKARVDYFRGFLKARSVHQYAIPDDVIRAIAGICYENVSARWQKNLEGQALSEATRRRVSRAARACREASESLDDLVGLDPQNAGAAYRLVRALDGEMPVIEMFLDAHREGSPVYEHWNDRARNLADLAVELRRMAAVLATISEIPRRPRSNYQTSTSALVSEIYNLLSRRINTCSRLEAAKIIADLLCYGHIEVEVETVRRYL